MRAALILALTCSTVSAQIELTEIERTTEAGMMRGLLAEVDLSRVEVVVTEPTPGPEEAMLISTKAFAHTYGLDLAVNANYFGWLKDGAADVIGLCRSDGQTISGARSAGGRWDPALVLSDGVAAIGYFTPEEAGRWEDAVAGVGGGEGSGLPGSLLLDDGVSEAETARVAPLKRHPRTCAGVSEDGTTLWLLVIDGRQEDWSVGATLPEAAAILLEAGAWDAVNLDGGGSTSLVAASLSMPASTTGSSEPVTNRPSGPGFRPVAVNLGFRVRYPERGENPSADDDE